MTTATPSTALATIQPAFTDAERLALAGFLAGYRGLTREAYALPGRSAVETGLDQLPRPARSRWSWQGVTNLSASKVMFAWQLLER